MSDILVDTGATLIREPFTFDFESAKPIEFGDWSSWFWLDEMDKPGSVELKGYWGVPAAVTLQVVWPSVSRRKHSGRLRKHWRCARVLDSWFGAARHRVRQRALRSMLRRLRRAHTGLPKLARMEDGNV